MQKGENLTKINVISACLGIHIPSKVSKKMLKLAEISIDELLPGDKGDENNVYNMLIHFKWATDYPDIITELKAQNLSHLLKFPKSRKKN